MGMRERLAAAGLRPKKSFGQNFLVDANVVAAIARACVPDDERDRARVVELGAGLGALTEALVPRARLTVAVERDRDLVPLLRDHLEGAVAQGRLRIEEADAQQVDVEALVGGPEGSSPRILAGNLPYQITGRLLSLATAQADQLERAVFMVQDEVAARLLASPGSKDYGALTVFVAAAFDVTRVMTVARTCFFPAPDVTSAVVALHATRPRRAQETPIFRSVVKGAFATRRKTLRNAWRGLVSDESLAACATEAGVSLDARGETLDVDAFARMAAALEGASGR